MLFWPTSFFFVCLFHPFFFTNFSSFFPSFFLLLHLFLSFLLAFFTISYFFGILLDYWLNRPTSCYFSSKVTWNTLHTCEEKEVFKVATAVVLNTCLDQIRLLISFYAYAPISELPYEILTASFFLGVIMRKDGKPLDWKISIFLLHIFAPIKRGQIFSLIRKKKIPIKNAMKPGEYWEFLEGGNRSSCTKVMQKF